MTDIRWNALKSMWLKKTRGISFEEIILEKPIKVINHPKKENQQITLFLYKDYIWAVPWIMISENEIFLKTLYPSRKYTKLYRRGEL